MNLGNGKTLKTIFKCKNSSKKINLQKNHLNLINKYSNQNRKIVKKEFKLIVGNTNFIFKSYQTYLLMMC